MLFFWMIELVMSMPMAVLFDSTESNTAYYNAIYALMDEPRLNPEEEKAGVFMAAPQVFELGRRAIARNTIACVNRRDDGRPLVLQPDAPPVGIAPIFECDEAALSARARDESIGDDSALIDHLGLEGIFDAVASARDRTPKPRRIVELCLKRAGVDASRAVYVATARRIRSRQRPPRAFSGGRRARRS